MARGQCECRGDPSLAGDLRERGAVHTGTWKNFFFVFLFRFVSFVLQSKLYTLVLTDALVREYAERDLFSKIEELAEHEESFPEAALKNLMKQGEVLT
jgi:hypothetical protein